MTNWAPKKGLNDGYGGPLQPWTNCASLSAPLGRDSLEWGGLAVRQKFSSLFATTPRGKTSDEAVEDVIEHQLPAIAELNSSGKLNVENFDVFCESGVFDVNQTKKMIEEAKKIPGMRINFHGEELSCLGSAEVSAELRLPIL